MCHRITEHWRLNRNYWRSPTLSAQAGPAAQDHLQMAFEKPLRMETTQSLWATKNWSHSQLKKISLSAYSMSGVRQLNSPTKTGLMEGKEGDK